MLAVQGVSLLVDGIFTAFDSLYTSLEEKKEHLSEVRLGFDNTSEELDGVNEQLDTMQKRIDELHEKDSLSLVEEQELKNLEQSVRYIKEKSELLESQKRKEAQELAKSNTETFNDEFGSYEHSRKNKVDKIVGTMMNL